MSHGYAHESELPTSVSGSAITNTWPIQVLTSNTLVVQAQMTLECNAAAGGFTVTLPASPAAGEIHRFPRTDSNAAASVVISGNGNLINDSGTLVSSVLLGIAPACLEMQWNGSNWIYI